METSRGYGLPKSERLHSTKIIEHFWTEGNVFFHYPFKVFFCSEKTAGVSCNFAIVVPKRNFKRAVHRNRLKRRIREAYRLNKSIIRDALQAQGTSLHFLLRYVSNEELPYTAIEQALCECLRTLAETVAPSADVPVPAAD